MTLNQKNSNGDHWGDAVNTKTRKPALVGLTILGVFVGGFGIWAGTAPLSGAAIAPGIVAASGQNMQVQHLEGGILEEILVKEGDPVKSGQPLFRLDATDAQTIRNRVAKAIVSSTARLERLQAERDGSEELVFSAALIEDAETAGLSASLAEQRGEFSARKDRLLGDAAIIDQTVEAQKERIVGLQSQVRAMKAQSAILREEQIAKTKLLRRGLTRKSEVNVLRRGRADIAGRIGSAVSAIAEAKAAIIEANERKNKIGADHTERAVSELNNIRQEISDLTERRLSAEKVLARVIVRAPADGLVVSVAKNAKGSVVRPGENLLVLLPTGSDFIVEARVNPTDKELVRKGQDAKLFFSTLDRRTPEVAGKITFIGVDQVLDPITNEAYFPARLKIADELPNGLRREQIFPGLPVETFIKTGDRTFLQYLIKPISDRFNRAFRES